MNLNTFQTFYIFAWMTLTLAALALALRKGRELTLLSPAYRELILQNWKIGFFVLGLVGIVVMAPYTGDPTWDYVDASFMAVLAYTTAPWSVGTLYRAVRGLKREGAEIFIAAIVWLFSASWSYDGYLLLRDGVYPPTWSGNLAASSFLYLFAGLMWNLEDTPEHGVHFSFTQREWPAQGGAHRWLRITMAAAIIATPVALIFAWLLFEGLGSAL